MLWLLRGWEVERAAIGMQHSTVQYGIYMCVFSTPRHTERRWACAGSGSRRVGRHTHTHTGNLKRLPIVVRRLPGLGNGRARSSAIVRVSSSSYLTPYPYLGLNTTNNFSQRVSSILLQFALN